MRHPITYAIDVVGGLRALGARRTTRLLLGNLLMCTGIGATVTAVGAAGVEAASVVDPGTVSLESVATPQAGEFVGVALALGAAAGIVQGMHQVSIAGRAAREAGRAAAREAHPRAGRRDGN